MKKNFIFHPFLFAVYPILFLFSYNIDQISISRILPPLAMVLGSVLFLFVGLKFLIHENHKSALLISLLVVLFFLYGHVFSFIQGWLPDGFIIGKHFYLELIWVGLITGGFFLILKSKRSLKQLTQVLNVASLIIVMISVINIAAYEIQHFKPFGEREHSIAEQQTASEEAAKLSRDIYYIVLDGYAHHKTLKDVYSHDNWEFSDFLSDKGFKIPSKSCSNYGATFLSLAATLNMDYINGLSETVGIKSKDQTVPRAMISNNKVSGFFKSKGYRIIHLNSGWGPTKYNKHADMIVNTGRNSNFRMLLFQTTMLMPWTKNVFGNGARERILNHFDKLAQISEMDGPKFVFAHIISPHPPYLFDANGNPVPESDLDLKGNVWRNREKYRNQLIFINKKVQTLVQEILKKSEIDPVIVIQADHGSASRMYEPGSGGWNNPTQDKLEERLRIFSAFYLPDDAKHDLDEAITPVNTFRFIFNQYLGANFEILPNRTYYSTYQLPYQFSDVTEQVAFDPDPAS